MPTNVTLNGTSYAIPATGEGGWGTAVTNYLIALSSGVLQKAGGSFTLTAETDFGATYGLKSVYFKSRNTPATAGIFRLGNAEAVSWRNAANSADLDLKVNSSDILEFGGNPITTLALGSAHEVLTMNAAATAAEYAKLDDDNIAAAAAIDAAKIADASVSNTEFQYLNGVTSSIQTQFGAKLDDVAAANDNEVPRFNTNGQALQNSGVTIDDSNNMAGIANVIISGAIDAASASNLDIGATTATTINIGRSGQTTVIKGDLQVEGTTTTVDSTVLDVADKNITINKGGNQASADGGGFTLEMSDATDVAMVYLSSLASRFKIGDVGSETEVMSVGAIQVITAQKAFDTQIWLKEITTPATPDSGYRALYPKSDGKLYTLNDAGEEIAVGSGSGQGEINYITNSDAETNTSDWTATGLATIARTDTAGELLRGTYSFKLASTGAGTIYTDFVIPEADENKKLKIEHDLKEISGYAAGEWTLKIIKDPAGAATDITPATTDIPGGQGQFLTTFDCTDADTYRLIYTCTGATNGVTIDNVIVGPGKVVQGFGGWAQYDETDAAITASGWTQVTGAYMPYKTQNGIWRMAFTFDMTLDSGTVTADTTFTVAGVTFGNQRQALATAEASATVGIQAFTNELIGTFVVKRGGGGAAFNRVIGSGDVELDSMPTWATDHSINLISDDAVAANARFYVDGFASSSTMVDATTTYLTTWNTGTVVGGGSFDGTDYTVPADGEYEIEAVVRWQSASFTSGGNGSYLNIMKNTSTALTETRYDFSTAYYPSQAVSYTGSFVKGDTIRLRGYQDSGADVAFTNSAVNAHFSIKRLADYTAGQALGFAGATTTQKGLNYAPKYVYEKSISAITNATYTSVTDASISLEAGTYIIEAILQIEVSHSVVPTHIGGVMRCIRTSDSATVSPTMSGGAAQYGGTSSRCNLTCFGEFTLTAADTVQLQGYIIATGGTVSSRNLTHGSVKITKKST